MHKSNHLFPFRTENISSITKKLNNKMQLVQSRSYSTYIKPISNREIHLKLNPWFILFRWRI